MRSKPGRSLALSAVLAVSLVLIAATQAMAAGIPVRLGAATGSEPPSVAVDSAGNALIVWSSTTSAGDVVQWCVLPVNASACSHADSLVPGGGETHVLSVQALVSGGTETILADVFGNTTALAGEPVQMWQSTDGGASFAPAAGGLSVASGDPSNDTVPVNAVFLPGGTSLGFGFETASGLPTFNAFPLADPPGCARTTCTTPFATLEPSTNPDILSNLGAEFASNTDGVMGMFHTNFTSGPFGCSAAKTVPFGTAFVFGDGLQSLSNDYNVSPGQPQTAWRTTATQLDCNVEFPALGAGPSGFGMLEQDDVSGSTIYHRFDGTTDSFDTQPVTVSAEGEQQPGLSQDGAGGVYATFLSGGAEGPIGLAYSKDGGKTFAGPATLDSGGGVSDLTSAVNFSGQGFAAWLDGGAVHAQTFQAADAVTPATVTPTATSTPTTVTLGVTCAVFPCTITLTLTAPGSSLVHTDALRRAAKAKHPKRVTLGTGSFTIKSKRAKHLTVKLNRKGRRALAGHHGTIKLAVGVTEKALGTTVKSTRSVRVKLPKAKRK
jgi:hypothetical protein